MKIRGVSALLMAVLLVTAAAHRAGAQVDPERVEALEEAVRQLKERVEQIAPGSERIAELERQIEILTEEIVRLRGGGEAVEIMDPERMGFAPAAAKVYRAGPGVSIGGYGEMLYENYAAEDESGAQVAKPSQADFLRGVFYFGSKFTDRILFNSEVEFEHGSTGSGGSASIEFAYIDYLITPAVGLRTGMLLAPLGFVNELHEPPIFLGTTRPMPERLIIPSTWRENGVGLFGTTAGLSWRAYLMNGLDASGFGASGLRGGRQKGARALAETFGLAARVDLDQVPGLLVGVSGYFGNSGQGMETTGGETISARTTIADLHADFRAGGAQVRLLYVFATQGDAALLNDALGYTGAQSVGSELTGWYLEGAYDVLRRTEGRAQLLPYVRYEQLDTQSAVPSGFSADPVNDRNVLIAGLAFKPILNVVWKADYQVHRNAAETGVSQFNFQMGYLF